MYLRFPQNIHIELTDKCNARCPMCRRTNRHGLEVTKDVKNVEISLDLIKKQFGEINFKHINYCGNLGDPIAAKDCFSIVEFFSKKGSRQTIHTNGSLKSKEWWRKIGAIPNLRVVFGIDGITEESHQLYRRGTSLKKILENAKAFNNAGGESVWQMIVFRHNENEIDQAREMSQRLGFKTFETLYTRRFDDNDTFIYWWKQHEYLLEPPSYTPIKKLEKKDFENYNISCKAKKDEEIYISADGSVWPCCYIPLRMNFFTLKRNEEKLNIHTTPIKDILDNMFFDDMEESFTENPLLVCIATCGIGHKNKRHRVINIQSI